MSIFKRLNRGLKKHVWKPFKKIAHRIPEEIFDFAGGVTRPFTEFAEEIIESLAPTIKFKLKGGIDHIAPLSIQLPQGFDFNINLPQFDNQQMDASGISDVSGGFLSNLAVDEELLRDSHIQLEHLQDVMKYGTHIDFQRDRFVVEIRLQPKPSTEIPDAKTIIKCRLNDTAGFKPGPHNSASAILTLDKSSYERAEQALDKALKIQQIAAPLEPFSLLTELPMYFTDDNRNDLGWSHVSISIDAIEGSVNSFTTAAVTLQRHGVHVIDEIARVDLNLETAAEGSWISFMVDSNDYRARIDQTISGNAETVDECGKICGKVNELLSAEGQTASDIQGYLLSKLQLKNTVVKEIHGLKEKIKTWEYKQEVMDFRRRYFLDFRNEGTEATFLDVTIRNLSKKDDDQSRGLLVGEFRIMSVQESDGRIPLFFGPETGTYEIRVSTIPQGPDDKLQAGLSSGFGNSIGILESRVLTKKDGDELYSSTFEITVGDSLAT